MLTLDTLRAGARRLHRRALAFAQTRAGRVLLRFGRTGLTVAIVGYLAYELTTIGWGAVWAALPTNPWFYAIFGVLYVALPVAEIVIYRLVWSYDVVQSIPAFLKKRVYNKDVLGYSGEVYFFAWARQHVGLADAQIARDIRDLNIVSSVASTSVSAVLLLVFLYIGEVSVTDWLGRQPPVYVLGALAATALVGALLVRLRRYLFALPMRIAALVFAIHCGRLAAAQGLQIVQWNLAMPEVPLDVWLTYAAAFIIVSRIPFVPNLDLIFLWAGIEMAGAMQVSEAGLAGMLGALAVLGKVVNAVLFAAASLVSPTPPDVDAVPDAASPDAVPPDAAQTPEPGVALDPEEETGAARPSSASANVSTSADVSFGASGARA